MLFAFAAFQKMFELSLISLAYGTYMDSITLNFSINPLPYVTVSFS